MDEWVGGWVEGWRRTVGKTDGWVGEGTYGGEDDEEVGAGHQGGVQG